MRVAFGRAFTRETAATLSNMRFHTSPTAKTTMGTSHAESTGVITTNGTTAASSGFAAAAINLGALKLTESEKMLGEGMGSGSGSEVGVITPGGSREDVHVQVREKHDIV